VKIAGLGTLLVLTAAAAHSGEKFPKCFSASREGHCVADVVEGNRLPPGKYVLTARVSGSLHNWDCPSFFVQVAE